MRALLAGLVTLVLFLSAETVPAASDGTPSSQAWTWCKGGAGISLDLQISGCTTAIQTGHLSKNDLAVAFFKRGYARKQNKEPDKAIADYDQAIKLNPNYADAFIQRGVAYKNTGNFDRALQDYAEALRLDPRNAKAFDARCYASDAVDGSSTGT